MIITYLYADDLLS